MNENDAHVKSLTRAIRHSRSLTVMSSLLLAGDVGGTKTWLGLFSDAFPRPELVNERQYPTLEWDGLTDLVDRFLEESGAEPSRIRGTAIGVAGPVEGNASNLTNVRWRVDGDHLGRTLGRSPVLVMNDLVAMAYAVPYLHNSEVTILQPGEPTREGAIAVIAPGTHLGEASLHRVRDSWVPLPSEGGHADFAARTAEEHELVAELRSSLGHVGRGELLSGPGLVRFHRHAHREAACRSSDEEEPPDAVAVSTAALDGRCAGCERTLERFVSALGAAAGDLGLRTLARGGVFLGGGIPTKILPALRNGTFLDAFRNKGALRSLTERFPVAVILEPRVGLIGAAVAAAARRHS